MGLSPGSRVGPYEIQEPLGSGGMGEVYRARDTKLHRDVALKVLPPLHSADPDRLARFDREAQLLASLNHPHIAAIYGVEEMNGVRALVLELVEGPTLADRIARGPMPIDEALPIARQITEALEAAHARGVVHRDLKPGNVKLRPDGAVKVLDFGLAKALDTAPVADAGPHSATMTSPAMTRAGLILGTAAYMSPEQAKGRAVDERTDIWAFGCVLFEMLTGRRAFGGEDVAETLAFVLTKEPDWGSLPPETPTSVRRLLRRCLVADRGRRLADIADARLELDEGATDPSPMGADRSVAAPPVRRLLRWLPWAIAAASFAAMLWLAAGPRRPGPSDTGVLRTSILLPRPLGGRWGGPAGANLALSPDGRRLAFVSTDPAGRRQLWMRTLDGTSAQPLAGTDDALSPFWSPDGRWLAFVAGGKLKKLDPSGGHATTLCESALVGGAWGPDDVILFTQTSPRSLARIDAAGGAPSAVTALASQEHRHVYPFFLADGRRFGYVSIGLGNEIVVYVASLEGGRPTPLPLDSAFVQYAQGFLLFARGGTLLAQRFDEQRNALVGAAVPVAGDLRFDTTPRGRYFSASSTGMLVYQEDPSPGVELVWYDREGRRVGTLGAPADYSDVSISPDGRRALVSVAETGTANRDLWMFDLARGVRTRFTVDPAPEAHNAWSPDGTRIAFDSRRRGHRDLYHKASDGTGAEEVLLEDAFDKGAVHWSPDGRHVLYSRRTAGTANLWVLPLFGDRKPFPFRDTPFFEVPGMFSPDGRWVAFGSNESGRWEVYVSPFDAPGRKTQVSTNGGLDPQWRGDGKELFFLSDDDRLNVAQVSAQGDRFEVGAVEPLFELSKIGPRITYDVSPDGQRVLAVTWRPQSATAPLTFVVDWPGLMQK